MRNIASPSAQTTARNSHLATLWSRASLFAAIAGTLLFSLGRPGTEWISAISLTALFLYGAEAIAVSRSRRENEDGARVFDRFLLLLDSLFLGLVTTYPLTTLPVTVAVILLLVVVIRADRGSVAITIPVLFFAAGAGAGWVLSSGAWSTEITSTPVAPWLLACSVVHLLFENFSAETASRTLARRMESLKKEQLDLKLKHYQLSRYLSPAVRDKIGRERDNGVRTTRKKLTIFFSDIVSFTEIAEDLEGAQLSEILNSYLNEMSEIAIRHGGTIDKFMGDGIMIFFGDPGSEGIREDAIACVSMALEMRRRMEQLSLEWEKLGIDRPLKIRIGINTGYCAVGNFGTEQRLDYTLLGTEVNVASRLESAAEPDEIVISDATYHLVKDQFACVELGEKLLKGINRRVVCHRVLDSRKNLGPDRAYVNMQGEGYSLFIDFDKLPREEKGNFAEQLSQLAAHLRDRK